LKHLADMIASVLSSPSVEPARPDAAYQLDLFEKRTGLRIPDDLRAFYARVQRAKVDDRYQFLPIELLQRTGAALQGEEWADSEPASWYAFCDVSDGNFVGIDLEPSSEGYNYILDCDHDDITSRRVIATSFAEFLEHVLSADGQLYYLAIDPIRTLDVPNRPPRAWLRREYEKWSLDPEVGPRICRVDGCGRLCVSLSVHCRRHHFEAVQRLPYPFDD
jgi:hypothetical protein